jgi:hypothetical protein
MGGARTRSQLNLTDPDYDDIDPCDPPSGIICPISGGGSGQWDLKVDVNRIGEGAKIDGKIYAPYFTPAESALQAVDCQVGDPCPPDPTDPTPRLPDLVDAWGQPIIYVRRARTNGNLVGNFGDTAQFYLSSMTPYTESTRLGRLARNQDSQSILNTAPFPEATFAQLLRHPGFGSFGSEAEALNGTPRGAFVLFSAGPDGIYFSRTDGAGTPKMPVDDIVENSVDPSFNTPRVVDEYDDIRVFGGG